jgi:tRNA A-37 threonylcarbamoyl transferase component Bud32/tetratricopeptide (TPR) repeat protein
MSPDDELAHKEANPAPDLVEFGSTHLSGDSEIAPLAVPSVEQFVGKTIGQYRIVSVMGSGGMSVVFRATHMLLGHDVALKLLLPDRYLNATAIKRFQQEAKSMIRLQSPHIVPLREFNVHEDGRPYLVTDLAEGETLSALLAKNQTLSVERAARIAMDVCEGLEEAHKQGIIHRDLKPSNVMVSKDVYGNDVCKILDFGIAKMAEPDESGGALTKSGELVGSPLYMSPEQCQGLPIDQRTDMYSLGCMLFECVLGRPPFRGANMIEILMHHLNTPAPPLVSGNALLDETVARCMQKQPADRFENIAELKEVLSSIAGGDSLPRGRRALQAQKRKRMALAALVVLLILCVGAGLSIYTKNRQAAYETPGAMPVMKKDITQAQNWLWPEPPMREDPPHVTADQQRHIEELKVAAAKQGAIGWRARSQHDLAVFSEQIKDWGNASQAYDRYVSLVRAPSVGATPELIQARVDALRCQYKLIVSRLIGAQQLHFHKELLQTLESDSRALIAEINRTHNQALEPALRSVYLLHGNALYLLRKFPEAADDFKVALELEGNDSGDRMVSSDAIIRARWADCERAKGKNQFAAKLYNEALVDMLHPAFAAEPPENELDSTANLVAYVNKLFGDSRFKTSIPSQSQRSNIVVGLSLASMIGVDENLMNAPEWMFFQMLTQETFDNYSFDDNALIYCDIMDAIATREARVRNVKDANRLRKRVEQVKKDYKVEQD